MEEANSGTFELNKRIMGSAQKPLAFDSEGGRILYGEETILSINEDQPLWLRNLIGNLVAGNAGGEKVTHFQNLETLSGLKKEEVDFLRLKHTGLGPEPPKWMPGSGHCPVPRGPSPF